MQTHALATAVAFLISLVGVVCGCTSDATHPPGIAPCTSGCSTGGGTSTLPSGDGGLDANDAGDAASTSLAGSVGVFTDDQFSGLAAYTGDGWVHVSTAAGEVVVPIGGDAGKTFSVDNALVGYQWFGVIPDDAYMDAGSPWGALVPTWSLLTVPEHGASSFAVPLVNKNVLDTLYLGLAAPTHARADAAQVVAIFERNGTRVPNVRINKAPTNEAVAYDSGLAYSTAATATGNAGVAILINTTGTGDIDWEVPNVAKGTVQLYSVAGGATVLKIEVP